MPDMSMLLIHQRVFDAVVTPIIDDVLDVASPTRSIVIDRARAQIIGRADHMIWRGTLLGTIMVSAGWLYALSRVLSFRVAGAAPLDVVMTALVAVAPILIFTYVVRRSLIRRGWGFYDESPRYFAGKRVAEGIWETAQRLRGGR